MPPPEVVVGHHAGAQRTAGVDVDPAGLDLQLDRGERIIQVDGLVDRFGAIAAREQRGIATGHHDHSPGNEKELVGPHARPRLQRSGHGSPVYITRA